MFSKNRDKGTFKKLLMTDDINFKKNNLICNAACGMEMSLCCKPRLGAAEIVSMKAFTESCKVLSHYRPLELPQLNSDLSHPQFNSGGNAYSM